MNGGSSERDKKIGDLVEKLQYIHAKHMAKLAELKAQQCKLLKDVMARIDREQAENILSKIKGGNLDNLNQ